MLSAFTWYFLSFNGRIGRQESALGFFGLVLVEAIILHGVRLAGSAPQYYVVSPPSDDQHPFLGLLLIASLWPFTAITVKRLHDLNLSGWWVLATLAIPYLSRALAIPHLILFLVAVVILCALPGQEGDNRFGRDPTPRLNGGGSMPGT
jgi:uncharacterized membrane protein YhaH (DUF805 family)